MTTSSITSPPSFDDLEIHVIPDEFYGLALKAKIEEKKVVTVQQPEAPRSLRKPLLIAGGVGVFVLLITGGFAFYNRDLLFPKPPEVVVVAPPPPLPERPAPPTDVNATATTAFSVTVSWIDPSQDESGFRIERSEDGSTFSSLTNLPANSTNFLDLGVHSSSTYVYLVRAINAGGESDPSAHATATVPLAPPLPPPIPRLPPAGLDSDSDGITDLEEILYSTLVRVPDTDGDGFLDGNEVFHLYNPAGKAPVKLLESGIIQATSTSIGWSLNIPKSWTLRLTADDGSKATIDSHHDEQFLISIEDNPMHLSVLDWYLAHHQGATSSQVLVYRSKGGYEGIIGADQLTTYLPWGDRIFVMTYDLAGQPFINFRTTYSMILNSLVLSGLPRVSLPVAGAVLPFEPSPTSVGVILQPVPLEQASSSGSTSSTP